MSETVTIQAKYTFTDAEKRELGSQIAERTIKKAEVTEAKKLAMSRFKESIDTVQQEINRLSANIANGYEFRQYETTVKMDYEKKKKSYADVNNGKIVDVRDFEPCDFQRKLELPNPEKQ